jgi:hypothetical protein
MGREIFTRTLINDDGSVATMDYTEEVVRMKRELKRPPKESHETMSVDEVALILKIKPRSVYNKIAKGDFAEGIHYTKPNKKTVLFYKKELLKMVGLS